MNNIMCITCKTTQSKTWWKCCSKHTTEQGLDVVCIDCANACLSGKEIVINDPMIDPRVVQRLKSGDWSFGHAGRHIGNGTDECPLITHHHHDEFCVLPTPQELRAAGIDIKHFRPKSRR